MRAAAAASNFVGVLARHTRLPLPDSADVRVAIYLVLPAGLKKLKPKEERREKRDGFCFWRFYWLLQRERESASSLIPPPCKARLWSHRLLLSHS